MPSFKLPRLKANLAIVNGQGRPLDYFLRLFNIELAQKLEEQETTQAEILAELQAVQQTQQDEIDRLNRVLAGTEPFSAVNVDGTIVAENAGLADAIVVTQSIATESVTASTVSYTDSSISVGPGTTSLQTVSATVESGDRVDINASAVFRLTRAAGIGDTRTVQLRVLRDGVLVFAVPTDQMSSGTAGSVAFGNRGLFFSEVPGAGTFTYTLQEFHGTDSGSISGTFDTRFMKAEVVKR